MSRPIESFDDIQELRQRVLTSTDVTDEELHAAIEFLRAGRASAAVSSTKKAAAKGKDGKLVQVKLDDLFKDI